VSLPDIVKAVIGRDSIAPLDGLWVENFEPGESWERGSELLVAEGAG
jgi:hypothetical protein